APGTRRRRFLSGSGVRPGDAPPSIIDLQGGQQPIKNEDGTVWLVFNGEIYNYRQLRGDLEQRGHRFATGTDTETIVHLYEEYGDQCVQAMRGMFAFALWDERRKRLLLARDRLGIKPLYYAEVDGRLIFASELKAILQLPEVEREFQWKSVHHVFTFPYTQPSESIIAGIHKLKPGHVLAASPRRPAEVKRYWDLSFAPDYGRSEDYFAERLRELIEESVRLHLVSDVPVGAFLSGGIDSSSVVASAGTRPSAAGRLPATASGLKTFSVGFSEQDYNELPFARLVAQQFGTEHYEVRIEPSVLEIIEDLVWHLDEPFGDSSAIPTYMVSKLASEHVKVVLSGDGGDELFAGYDKYAVERRERNLRFLPAAVRRMLGGAGRMLPESMPGRRFLQHISLAGMERYLDACALLSQEEKDKLFHPQVLPLLVPDEPFHEAAEFAIGQSSHWLSALQYLDITGYLPLDILTKVDRMSMAHSLEVRVPLLDHKLVEFAATIPPELKLRRGTTKYIFKRAMRRILPDEIIDRPKQGFAVPLGHWFRGKLKDFVRDLLLGAKSRQRGIYNPAYIERLLDRHGQGRDLDLQLWTLISFELWCRMFLDEKHPHHARGSQALKAPAAVRRRAPRVYGPGAARWAEEWNL
ncbi:MAG: asparagine synthase (glutamine-hydrolyzing), partial [Acidobacteria bacterium]|nr:asparagine synthase (glutamine-hydrolyzing) [Acidobacteriota bacterium]